MTIFIVKGVHCPLKILLAIFSVQICTVIADDLCRCISPNINQSSSRELSDQPIRANVTFFLDNKLTELANGDEIEFLFYPDPKFEQFAGRVRNISNNMKVLTIGVGKVKPFNFVVRFRMVNRYRK